MAINFNCPKCNNSISVAEAFSGSRVDCPSCKAVVILDVTVPQPAKTMVVSRPEVVSPQADAAIKIAAMEYLASWIDSSPKAIQLALSLLYKGEAYSVWQIPKGNGSFREISAPHETLKTIQRQILDRLLYRIPVSNAAHGFLPSRSIVTYAAYHLNTAQTIFNIDLKSAFPSVKATRVKHILVRYLKTPLQHLGENIPHPVLDKLISLLVQLLTYNDALPQGSPASGCLLNIACITLDKNMYRLLQTHGASYRYTRYADDMTISAPMAIADELQEKIQKVVKDCGFQINPQKVRYADRSKGQKLEVTGLILEKGKIRIPAEKMESFRALIHNASNLPAEQLTPEKKLEIQSTVAFIKMVYGNLPNRLWGPYKLYLEKHKIPFQRTSAKLHWQQYPLES